DRCEECGVKIYGTAFTCYSCKVWKHISCADKLNRDLPLEITHPLHLQHRLQLQWDYSEDFICDKCLSRAVGSKDGKKKTIFHHSHGHVLSFFKYRKVCSDKRPRTLSHSLHPKHPLRLTFAINIDKCDVCSENRDYSSPVYVCEMCSFSLDFHCAKLSPSLKLDCHHHLLTFFKYFSKEGEEGQDSYCKAHVAFI
ncbi:hypothetical protein Godav_028309, partial [Gossypium davidsonii]|nr:hypothetical protein [Gossypium davidsonii]